ncbi:MAG: hypothetical protein M5R36_12390 [Deltaproteobacteria bacterium]|nr:hypothetical protein [Deltaproteobacteria bacterium]
MPARFFLLLAALALLVSFAACSCGDDDDDNDDAADDDDSDDDTGAPAQSVFIAVSPDADASIRLAAEDAADLLRRAYDGDVSVVEDASAEDDSFVIALTNADTDEPETYDIVPGGDGRTVAVTGSDVRGTRHGLYRLLEEFGFRFFHPEETFIPHIASFGVVPPITESPAYPRRGFHFTRCIPSRRREAFLVPGEENLRYAKNLIDWLARNRQNYFQFELLRTVDYEAAADHYRAIIEYAHARQIDAGVTITWAFQQQKSVEARSAPVGRAGRHPSPRASTKSCRSPGTTSTSKWAPPNSRRWATRLQVAWMDITAAYLAEHYPDTECSVKVHVSTGQTAEHYGDINFNFLPQFADARMGVYPHTVMYYDLAGPAPTYGNDGFSHMYDWLLEQVGSRKVYYYPETAYWVSFDIDIPTFLPLYALARWKDIDLLAGEGLDGHVTFTSGHEWGYWLNDWIVARATFTPGAWPDHVAAFAGVFGDGASAVADAVENYADLQYEFLVDRALAAYLAGQDTWDEIGYLLGGGTQARPVKFQDIDGMDAGELEEYASTILVDLGEMAEQFTAAADGFRNLWGLVDPAARPWYEEIADGMDATALRATHAFDLHSGCVERRRFELGLDPNGEDAAAAFFEDALAVSDRVRAVIAEREQHYRYPSGCPRPGAAITRPTTSATSGARTPLTGMFDTRNRRSKRTSTLFS